MWEFESREESNEDNVTFAEVLRYWLEQQKINTDGLTGVILVLQEPDGFQVLQLSHKAMTDGQLALYMERVGEHLRAAMARLN
jgi:hypothetical protein